VKALKSATSDDLKWWQKEAPYIEEIWLANHLVPINVIYPHLYMY